MSKLLPAERQQFNRRATSIDVEGRRLVFADGSAVRYDALLSTIPLDKMLRWCGKTEWADGLQHSSSHIIGLGLRGVSPHALKCWLYFPEDNCPFYRYGCGNVSACDTCMGFAPRCGPFDERPVPVVLSVHARPCFGGCDPKMRPTPSGLARTCDDHQLFSHAQSCHSNRPRGIGCTQSAGLVTGGVWHAGLQSSQTTPRRTARRQMHSCRRSASGTRPSRSPASRGRGRGGR